MKRLVLTFREAMAMFSKLIGYKSERRASRKPGMFAGQINIKPGFDEIPEGFDKAFE